MARQKTIFGINATYVYAIVLILLLAVGYHGYNAGWFDNLKSQSVTDNGLLLDKELVDMKIGNSVVADQTANYNADSGVIAVQVDAEKSANATHTTFVVKTMNASGSMETVKSVVQTGVLSEPSEPVTVTVTAEIDLNYVSGFTNTNEILSSSISATAPTMKTAGGEVYYPVSLKNDKPAVYVNDVLGGKNLSWTVSDTTQKVIVTFDLDWEGLNKMISISDEIQVPIKFTNTENPTTIPIRIIKNSAL
ncbi:MAG: hypothetical protein RBR02_09505 [Desulfuromonadaceae bacterium]|nr:hypothetical protein [Desulfuromonadaceae bacterium]